MKDPVNENTYAASQRKSPGGRRIVFLILIAAVILAAVCLYVIHGRNRKPDYSWTEHTYICHAMGAVDDSIHYTNTAEAFRINYEKGYRVFELDMEYTSDHKIVCLHGWGRSFFKKHLGIIRDKADDGVPMSYDEFMSLTFHDKYPASDFRMICEQLKEYPDAWLVLDGKVSDPESVKEQYTELVSTLKEICPEALPRVIPQIYNEEMFDIINDIYKWNTTIFTLYQLEKEYGESFDPQKEADFAAEHGIGVLTVSYELFKAHNDIVDYAHQKGLKVFVHTVDSEKKWAKLKEAEVDGIYTNWRLD